MSLELIQPNWGAPANVKAFCSTRQFGFSREPWQSLNLALHVGDNAEHVAKNRKKLSQESELPNPKWLNQTHSVRVVRHNEASTDADACFTEQKEQSCIVMTADCLPILLCNQAGSWVAAVHAGWRGLAGGIIANAIEAYSGDSPLLAWIGPAISQANFEVGDEVKQTFLQLDNKLEQYFLLNPAQRWQCDLASIAEVELNRLNVSVHQSGLCSYSMADKFYSHRRATHEQGKDATTGRMATAIWFE